MPTGYTAAIEDGTCTQFPDFAMRCARAMGALIMMRDESLDAEIPQKFEPSDYYANALSKAKADLANLVTMSLSKCESACQKDYADNLAHFQERVEHQNATAARYKAMLAKVEEWRPPTPDHVEFKRFMRDQLSQSLEWDCGHEPEPPVAIPPSEWVAARKAKLERDIEYYEKQHAEEVERTDSRNRWVAALRGSLQ